MNITLEHDFLSICQKGYDLESLMTGNTNLSQFVAKLKKQAQLHPDRNDPKSFIGDGFEMFVEALFKLSPVDNRLGISNYQNAPRGEAGVDGFGIGLNRHPATVQVKFKSDHETLITETKDNIAGFLAKSQSSTYNVLRDDFATNLLIVTYGKGLHHKTIEHFFEDGVRVLSREDLRQLVDNNYVFWDKFKELASPWFNIST